MLIFRFIILFWATVRRDLHALNAHSHVVTAAALCEVLCCRFCLLLKV